MSRLIVLALVLFTGCAHGEYKPVHDSEARMQIIDLRDRIDALDNRINTINQQPILDRVHKELQEARDYLVQAELELNRQKEELEIAKHRKRQK